MSSAPYTVDGIVDIEPPLLPPETNWDVLVIAVAALLLSAVLITMLWRRHHGLRGWARRCISQLHTANLRQQIDVRQAAFRIAEVLRTGLDLHQVSRATHLPHQLEGQQQRWDSFTDQLSRARYAPARCSRQEIEALLSEATFWLRRWP